MLQESHPRPTVQYLYRQAAEASKKKLAASSLCAASGLGRSCAVARGFNWFQVETAGHEPCLVAPALQAAMSILGRLMGFSTSLAAKVVRREAPLARSFSLLSRPSPISAERRLWGPVQAAAPSPVSTWFREMCIFKKGDYNVFMGMKKIAKSKIKHPIRVMDPRVRALRPIGPPQRPHLRLFCVTDQAAGAEDHHGGRGADGPCPHR